MRGPVAFSLDCVFIVVDAGEGGCFPGGGFVGVEGNFDFENVYVVGEGFAEHLFG